MRFAGGGNTPRRPKSIMVVALEPCLYLKIPQEIPKAVVEYYLVWMPTLYAKWKSWPVNEPTFMFFSVSVSSPVAMTTS